MNVDKLLVEAGAYFGGDGINYDRFEPRKFAALVLANTPPQRKPLTKEEMFEAIRPLYSSDKAARLTVNHSEDEYRAIEAAHGIKGNA